MKRIERIELYGTFSSFNSSRVVAGLMYESLGHEYLRDGGTLTLKPMRRRKAKTLFHWESCEGADMPVTFPSNPAIIYEDLTSIEPNHLYVPSARNQPAFDSFLKLDATLYFFQFTLSETHDIKEFLSGRLDILRKRRTGVSCSSPLLGARSMSRRLLR